MFFSISIFTILNKMPEKKYFIAVDIELLDNVHVNAVGVAISTPDGKLKEKRIWWIKVSEESGQNPLLQRDRCIKDFWEKNEELYKTWKVKGGDEAEVIKDLVNFWDSRATEYGVSEEEIRLVSDNPETDYGRLTPYLEKHCNRQGLRFTKDGTYRSIDSIDDALWYVGIFDIIKNQADKFVKHDHFPDNDAHHILLMYILGLKALGYIKTEFVTQGDNIKTLEKVLSNCAIDFQM